MLCLAHAPYADSSFLGFSGSLSFFRRFKSVVEGVSDEVHEYVAKFLKNHLVNRDVGLRNITLHFFSEVHRLQSDCIFQWSEDDSDREHTKVKNLLLHIEN
ncbi:MAG: hypothetical protein IJP90_12600 [Treponema sp.]|nr:hypothetical protein [Treponema sp.]